MIITHAYIPCDHCMTSSVFFLFIFFLFLFSKVFFGLSLDNILLAIQSSDGCTLVPHRKRKKTFSLYAVLLKTMPQYSMILPHCSTNVIIKKISIRNCLLWYLTTILDHIVLDMYPLSVVFLSFFPCVFMSVPSGYPNTNTGSSVPWCCNKLFCH